MEVKDRKRRRRSVPFESVCILFVLGKDGMSTGCILEVFGEEKPFFTYFNT